MQPLVSIIVPCYNKAEYLSEALDSVKKQTYNNWECIIVNDGSLDNTEEIAKLYTIKDTRFKYLYQQNQGVSVARNNGINASNGEYILPLDADDIIDPTYVEKAINHYIHNPSTKLVYCKYDTFGLQIGDANVPDYNYEELLWTCMIPCCSVFKRVDFNRTIGYNPIMKEGYEDWDFLLSFLDRSSIVYRIDEVLFHYRKTGSSRNDSADNQSDKLFIQIYKNHKEIYEPYAERVIIDHHHYLTAIEHANEIYNTSSYKLGYTILRPIVKIKEFLKSIKILYIC